MYPVTATYKTKIKELERVFQARIQIQHSQGVLNLTDKDIALGSLIYNEASQAGEDFTIGGVVASDLTVSILNRPEYANLQFVGATLTASIGLEIDKDTETYEWVPLGVFHIDEIGKTRNVIRIKAIDAMINLDMPYTLSKLVYPATLLQIFTNICAVCDIQQGSHTFPNSSHVVEERPRDAATFRDILAYVAEMSGTFARTTRTGALELVWYEESGLTLTGANRFDFVPRDDKIQITGITAAVDGVTYIAGGGVESDIYTESGDDFSSGELDGVVVGEGGLGLEQTMGKALRFDGVDDYVEYGDIFDLRTNDRTYECKFKLSTALLSSWATLIGKVDNGSTPYRHSIAVTPSGEIYVIFRDRNNSNYDGSFKLPLFDTNEHHLAWIINRSGSYEVFIDGESIGTKDISACAADDFVLSRPFRIGAYTNKADNSPILFFPGIIDDVRIWNIAHTQQQIQDNMNKELSGNETGLVGYWKFNEGEGNTAYDSTANGNDGTIYGATWVDGIVGSYLEQGSRTSPPLDLSGAGTDLSLRAAWQATVPEGTSVKVLTAVTGETVHTGEAVGTGDGIEDTFYLDYYPAERHNDLIAYVDGVQTTEYTRPDANNPRKIVFNAGHEPGNGFAVTADYTGVEYPAYDPGDWEEQTSDKTITNLPEGDFTGKWLWIKQVLETENTSVTPLLEMFRFYSVTEGGMEYLVDLSNNPLLQSDYETVLGTIYGAVKGVSFYPFTSSWQGNPAVQAGDIITQVDRDGKPYKTLVTHSTYKYRGASTLQGKGLPVKAKGYKGSTNRKFAEIIRKIDEVVGDKLTTLEQAQLHATEMIANMLGGHAIFEEDAIYIADSEDLDEAVKIWKWGLGGFGYSSTGKDGPYTTAITADGTIVAMLVAAGIVTADMIQTGVLQSQDESSWFNLDNGTFNLKNLLKWVNNHLLLREPEDKARLAIGTDIFAMQAYDEEKEEWTNKLYFDPVQGLYVFDGMLSASMIAALEAQFDVTVSNVTITNVLAAETGYIAQLTVDQLDTSTKVQKYLNQDTSDVNYIKIHDKQIEFMTASTDGTQTEQAQDRHGNFLYWKDEQHDTVLLEETNYPVMMYVYEENPKMSMTFDEPGYTPKITMGFGDGIKPMSAKAEIFKGQTGLELNYYRSNTEELRQIIIDDAGIRQTGNTGVTGLRNITISAEAPTLSEMEIGDVWLQYSDE